MSEKNLMAPDQERRLLDALITRVKRGQLTDGEAVEKISLTKWMYGSTVECYVAIQENFADGTTTPVPYWGYCFD